jgi:hypothetical protein
VRERFVEGLDEPESEEDDVVRGPVADRAVEGFFGAAGVFSAEVFWAGVFRAGVFRAAGFRSPGGAASGVEPSIGAAAGVCSEGIDGARPSSF